MMTENHVLIVSTIADIATDYVVHALIKAGVSHHRLNTEELPFKSTLAFNIDNSNTTSLIFDHDESPQPSAIWYRKVRSPVCPELMDKGVYEFCLQENRAALLGSLTSINTSWMSHPASVWQAEFKPFQLQLAKQVGLKIPRTLITNEPAAISDAFNSLGSMIVKPCRSGYAVVNGEERSIYTSRLLKEHLEFLDEARWSPAIYQELIPKRFDIRATVVGTEIFAAAIDSQSDPSAVVDWRHTDNPQLPHYAIELPNRLQDALLELMSKLGLTFGAIDLVQTPDGEFIFLEVNPNGQWLWIDDQLELGISDAIATWLSKK